MVSINRNKQKYITMKSEHFGVRSSTASCLQSKNLNKSHVATNNKFNERESVCTNASI